MTVHTQNPERSDILVELWRFHHCTESKTVVNAGASAMTLKAGLPMDDNVPVDAGDEANTDGLLADTHVIPAGESKKVLVISKAPVTCRADGIQALDKDGAALATATIQATLEALDFVFRDEPETTEQQTT